MHKSYYLISWRPEYSELLRSQHSVEDTSEGSRGERALVTISEGGFGEGVVDFKTRVKEKFLEYEFSFRGIELPCTEETFDVYFSLEIPTEVLDLDDD